jgi:Arc/MetJ-type ribon-helix-helix transcriptional regulator
MEEKSKLVSKHFRLSPVDEKILKEAVELGRALNESDALRMAIRQLGESNRFTRKIRAL